jgi:hypothetical protein
MQQLLQAVPAQQQQQLQQEYVITAERISRFGSSSSGSSSSSRSSSHSSPVKASRLLTGEITRCSSWRELQQLHTTAAPRMNAIHVSAMLSTLGKLLRAAPAEQHELQGLEVFLQALERTSVQLLSTIQVCTHDLCLTYKRTSASLNTRPWLPGNSRIWLQLVYMGSSCTRHYAVFSNGLPGKHAEL